jgi:hypothetical protein
MFSVVIVKRPVSAAKTRHSTGTENSADEGFLRA